MKKLFVLLIIIALTACGGSGGGSTPQNTGSISGLVRADTTLNLTGQSTATTTANENASYSFTSLANGDYVVTPTLAGYTFSPPSISVKLAGGNYPRVDFSATATTAIIIPTQTSPRTYNLSGVTANGVTLGGNLISPVTLTAAESADGVEHTYYYWDISGDGTNAGVDYLTHDVLDQIFNGGVLGDSASNTTNISSTNTVTLSNGLVLHLPTRDELILLSSKKGSVVSFGHGWVDFGNWSSSSQIVAQIINYQTQLLYGYHYFVDMWNGSSNYIPDTYDGYVSFEVL